MPMQIKRAQTLQEIESCVPLLLQLRPHYTGQEQQMILQIQQQCNEQFELYYVQDQQQVVACAGIRLLTLLAHHGTVMYIADLITDQAWRSQGYAKALIDYLCDYAKAKGCTTITLDSGVQRTAAHRFYAREHFTMRAHHFIREV